MIVFHKVIKFLVLQFSTTIKQSLDLTKDILVLEVKSNIAKNS